MLCSCQTVGLFLLCVLLSSFVAGDWIVRNIFNSLCDSRSDRKRCDQDGRRREVGSFLLLTPGLFSLHSFSPFLSSPCLLWVHIPSHFLFIIGQKLKKRGEKVVDDRRGKSYHSSSYYLPIIIFLPILMSSKISNWWGCGDHSNKNWKWGFSPEQNKLLVVQVTIMHTCISLPE